jgi:carbon-monoxide dehydrogenase large subunit
MGSQVFRGRGMAHVPGMEAATVRVDADGIARCAVSFPSQGQGHTTAVAQVVADRLGLPLDRVRLAPVDTGASPAGSGTFGSRFAVAMTGSVGQAADLVRRKLVVLAARLLEASPDDIVLADGRAGVRGAPGRDLSIADLARCSHAPDSEGHLASGLEPGLGAAVVFDPPGPTFSGAVHVAAVEVDGETGRVHLTRYAVVEDCGPLINPLLVDGQIEGAVAQGIGEALLEGVVYDAAGQLLTATLLDYALPRAGDLPAVAIGHLETPAPHMPGGVKGMGEGGAIGAPAAVANAVADAVRPLGVPIRALPIRPWGVLGAMSP